MDRDAAPHPLSADAAPGDAPIFSRPFVTLLLVQVAFGLAFSSYLLLPKILTAELGAGPDVVGRVVAVEALGSLLAVPVVGPLIDRVGRRTMITAGVCLELVVAIAYFAVSDVGPLLYVLRGLQGVAFIVTFNAAATLAADLAPPARLGQAMGIFGMAMMCTNAIAPGLAEPLVAAHGMGVLFAVAAGSTAFSAVASRFLPADGPGAAVARASAGAASVDGPTSVAGPASDGSRGAAPSAWTAPLLGVYAAMFLTGSALGVMFTFTQPLSLARGITEVRTFFYGYTAAALGVRTAFGNLADRLGRRRVAAAALGLYGASVLGALAIAPGTLWIVGTVFGVAHGFAYPALTALAVEGADRTTRGAVMTFTNGALKLGVGVAVFGLGQLAPAAGLPAVFVITAFIAWTAIPALLVGRSRS